MTDAKDKDPSPWTYQLFGCFDDPMLCIFTFLVPCYTLGRNGEALEEDGLQVCILQWTEN